MSKELTTCIVAIQFPATWIRLEITGIRFYWRGKIRTLWFRNYEFPELSKAKRIHTHQTTFQGGKIKRVKLENPERNTSEYSASELTVECREEVTKHGIPQVRIFLTKSQDGKMNAFHLEKANGLPFNDGEMVIHNLHG
jgi:hypothetical protein